MTLDQQQLVICPPFLDRAKFAEVVGVSKATVDKWVADGRLQVVVMGKRSLVDLRPWLTFTVPIKHPASETN